MIVDDRRIAGSGRTVALFFALAYALIWLCTLPLILHLRSAGEGEAPGGLLALAVVGNYSPLIAALLLTARTEGRAGLRRLLGRVGRWRVGARWFLFALLYPPLMSLLALGIVSLATGRVPPFPDDYALWMLPIVFLIVFFQAGVAEEIGWRGFALPRLQGRFSALGASLILGVIWTFWHLPSAFIPGTYHFGQGPAFWLTYLVDVVALTMLLTVVFNGTGGSLLLPILFHTATNVTAGYLPTMLSLGGLPIEPLLHLIVAVGLLLSVGGARRLAPPTPDAIAPQPPREAG